MGEEVLKTLIRARAAELDVEGTAMAGEGDVLLATIAFCESDFGRNNRPRVEAGYCPGGRYYRLSAALRRAYSIYGKAAASSWGPWQIMFLSALESGFLGAPRELAAPAVSIGPVIAYCNHRILRWEGVTVAEFADAYNSGSFEDQNIPEDYIKKFVQGYRGEARQWIRG